MITWEVLRPKIENTITYYSHRNGIAKDELENEAWLCWRIKAPLYDASRGLTELVYLKCMVNYHLKAYCIKQLKPSNSMKVNNITPDFSERVVDHLLVEELLEGLVHEERQVVVLRYYGGYTQCDVAKKLSISQTKVCLLLKAVLEKLKNQKNH